MKPRKLLFEELPVIVLDS